MRVVSASHTALQASLPTVLELRSECSNPKMVVNVQAYLQRIPTYLPLSHHGRETPPWETGALESLMNNQRKRYVTRTALMTAPVAVNSTDFNNHCLVGSKSSRKR